MNPQLADAQGVADEDRRQRLAESVALSQQSLKVAREQRDAFLESSDLLNLGRAAIVSETHRVLSW